jgi:hypothetical protein
VERWASRLRYLRWLDTLGAWLALWLTGVVAVPSVPAESVGVATLLVVGLLSRAPALRLRWRPVSAAVGLTLSRALRAGDHAWYVTPGRAEPVIVTARHRLRLTIARPDLSASEGLQVRRTRVLLLPPP